MAPGASGDACNLQSKLMAQLFFSATTMQRSIGIYLQMCAAVPSWDFAH